MWETRVDAFVSAVARADVFVIAVLYTCVHDIYIQISVEIDLHICKYMNKIIFD